MIGNFTLGCDSSDVGSACPELLETTDARSEDGRSETEEIVGINPRFPCDDLVCIATNGDAGYCSKKCRSDDACPSAFECRTVQAIGEFASDQFCAWRRCEEDDDCGDSDDYCCRDANNSDPINEVRLCGFRDSNECS